MNSSWIKIIRRAIKIWLDSYPFVFAGALAFYTIFSIAPLIVIAVSIASAVLDVAKVQAELTARLHDFLGDSAGQLVQSIISNVHVNTQNGWLPLIFSILAMIFGATSVFGQLQTSLNAIWEVVPKPSKNSIFLYLRTRLLSTILVCLVSFILLSFMLMNVALRAVIIYAEEWMPLPSSTLLLLDYVLSFFVVWILFSCIFTILPDVKIKWKNVLPAAFVTAILFSIGRYLIAVYLSTMAPSSIYGAAGSLVVLLLWINYSSLIILFGAALTRAHHEIRNLAIIPSRLAAKLVKQVLEE